MYGECWSDGRSDHDKLAVISKLAVVRRALGYTESVTLADEIGDQRAMAIFGAERVMRWLPVPMWS